MEGEQGGGAGLWQAEEFWDLVLRPPAIVTEAPDPATITDFPVQVPLAEVPEQLVSLPEPIVPSVDVGRTDEGTDEPEPMFGEWPEWGEPSTPPPMSLALDLWMPSTELEVSNIERPERSGSLPEVAANLEASRWTAAARRRAVAGAVCGGLLLMAWALWPDGNGNQLTKTAQLRPPVTAAGPLELTTTPTTTAVVVVETVPMIVPTIVAPTTQTPAAAVRTTSTSPIRSAPPPPVPTTPVPTTSSPPTTESVPTTTTVSTTTTALSTTTTALNTTTTTSRGLLDGAPGAPGRSG